MRTLKDYITSLLTEGCREDGRSLLEYRPITIEVNPIPKANGSARVKIGATEVLVGVKLDVGEPFPDTPDSGVLIVNAELIPLASPEFEPGPPKEEAIELARIVDRTIRESGMIDLEKLCIKKKEKVWMVFVDIYPLNDEGNLFDAGVLGAIVALRNAKMPKYDKKEEVVLHKELTTEKLPLQATPILNTFCKLNGVLFVDATTRERKASECRLSIATKANGHICAMQKGEFGSFTADEILRLVDLAIEKGKELRQLIK